MATMAKKDRIDVRLSTDLKNLIEQAAMELGQSVSDFVVGTMARRARKVIQQSNVTELSARDRDRFIALLDDVDAAPNAALIKAAARYKAEVA